MDANELMIGNWVEPDQCRIPTEYCRVEGIYPDGTVHLDKAERLFTLDELHPIPITPEILKKNGFKKFNFHNIEKQHLWTWWLDTLTSITLWCRELYDDAKDGWMIRIESQIASCCHKVEYVHELQHSLRVCGINKEIVL